MQCHVMYLGFSNQLSGIQFNLFCSRNPYLVIQPPDVEEVNNQISM
jgi:hypothetical protein